MNRRSFLVALGVAMLAAAGQAVANAAIEVTRAQLDVVAEPGREDGARRGPAEHTLLLSADIQLPLTDTLKDSIDRGLALYFQTDVQVVRPRWYWLNEEIISTSIEWRLSYHALTRQYRVATNAQGQTAATLAAPARPGYVFNGWFTEAGAAADFAAITENTTLVAGWKAGMPATR